MTDQLQAGDDSDADDPQRRFDAWVRALARERHSAEGSDRGTARSREGTAALIDANARRRGAATVIDGTAVSLSRPLRGEPRLRDESLGKGFTIELTSLEYHDGAVIGLDHVELDPHGVENTHIDALNHIGVDGTLFDGWPIGAPDGPDVADLAWRGIITRALLVDVPALRGEPWVVPGDPVTEVELDAAVAASGVPFESGDALLLYMGRDRYEAAGHEFLRAGEDGAQQRGGVGERASRWIVEHGVSAVLWDFQDAIAPGVEPASPVHTLIWAVGLVLVDNCDFSRVVPKLRAAGRLSGLLVVAPLLIGQATGSNVNPMLVI